MDNQKMTFKDLIQNQNNLENFINPFSMNLMNQIPVYPAGYYPSLNNQNVVYGMIPQLNSDQNIQFQNQIMINQPENKIINDSKLNNYQDDNGNIKKEDINENPNVIRVLQKMDNFLIQDQITLSRSFCMEAFISDSFLKLNIKCEDEIQNWENFFEYFPLNDFSLSRLN